MALDQEKVDSVYDFLYVDQGRLASLLVQFGNEGILTELIRLTDAGSDVEGNLGIGVAKLGAKETSKSSISRRFDPKSLLPLLFLDKANSLFVRGIENAKIGQFVLAEGDLSLHDVSIGLRIFQAPSLRRILVKRDNIDISGLIKGITGVGEMDEDIISEGKEDVLELITDVIGMMPGGVQATQTQATGQVIWSTLRESGLVVTPGEIALTHGRHIPGKWIIIGILDSLPDQAEEPSTSNETAEIKEQKESDSVGFPKIFSTLPELVRRMMGRPARAYGITPLLVFRQIEVTA